MSCDVHLREMLAQPIYGLCELVCFRNDQKRRFYKVFVGQDLFGDMVLIRQWGSLDNRQGNCQQSIISLSELIPLVSGIVKEREKRGYVLI